MSKPVKFAVVAVIFVLAFAAFILIDWYRFTTSGAIDPKRGVYGNPRLEVWIDINARMPEFMRTWACTTLRGREKIVLGGQNTLPFYSCQPGFGSRSASSDRASTLINTLSQNAIAIAAPANATSAQRTQLAVCITETFAARVTNEQRAALNAPKLDTSVLTELNKLSPVVRKECLAKAGL